MKVKNISGKDLTLIGIGIVPADGVADVPEDFNNVNFEKIEAKKEAKTEPEKSRNGKK